MTSNSVVAHRVTPDPVLDEWFPRQHNVSAIDVMLAHALSEKRQGVRVEWDVYQAAQHEGYTLKNVVVVGAPMPPKPQRRGLRWR